MRCTTLIDPVLSPGSSSCFRPFQLPVLAAVAIAAAACGTGRAAPTGPAAPPPALVQVADVQISPIEDSSTYVATIQSLSSTSIKPEVAGVLTKILVKSGDRVAPGTPLFVIDPSRQEASVSS